MFDLATTTSERREFAGDDVLAGDDLLLLSLENSNSSIFLPAFKAWRIKLL